MTILAQNDCPDMLARYNTWAELRRNVRSTTQLN